MFGVLGLGFRLEVFNWGYLLESPIYHGLPYYSPSHANLHLRFPLTAPIIRRKVLMSRDKLAGAVKGVTYDSKISSVLSFLV